MRAHTWLGLLAVLWCAGPGCVVSVQQPPPVVNPRTPPRLEGQSAPPLEATALAGVKRAAIDVPDVYYHEAKERWFRWWLDGWFVAFLWNGQWYPVDEGELPGEMAALQPTRQEKKERRLTRKEELKQIDEELKRIEEESKGEQPEQESE